MAFTLLKRKPVTAAAIVAIVLIGGALLALPFLLGPQGYPIQKSDRIASWSWRGAYADHGSAQQQAEAEIARLKGMLGASHADEYGLSIGIASEYELLGDGKGAYRYLSRAIAIDPKRGLAYMNMGHLMEELGAFATARGAYDAAVQAEPGNAIYAAARSDFYLTHPAP